MPPRSFSSRGPRALLCAITATAIGVLGTVPLTLFTATAAHADSPIDIVTAEPGDEHINLTWTDAPNGTVDEYRVDCTPVGAGDPGSATIAYGDGGVAVNDLTNFEPYTCVVTGRLNNVDVTTSAPSDEVTPGRVPNAPTIASVVVNGPGSIAVAATPDPDDDSPVVDYTAACTSEDDGADPGFTAHSASPVTVSGLLPGATYTCIAATNNDFGGSAATDPSDPILVAALPDAPTLTGATPGNTQVSVAFTPPADDGGSPITSYTAMCTPVDVGPVMTASGSTSPISVTGLTNLEAYWCSVHATTLAGDSDESETSSMVTPTAAATAPAAPAKPTVEVGDEKIAVSFVAPDDGGSAITGYTASCTLDEGGPAGSATGTVSPIVVTGLDNGSDYFCNVLATNAVDDGDPSPDSDTVTVHDVDPSPPTVTGVTRGNGTAIVFVDPGFQLGSDITMYHTWCASNDGGDDAFGDSASSPITTTGLTLGKTYACTSWLTNSHGTGNNAVFSSDFTAAGVPDAPSPPTVAPHDASITASFSAPVSDGFSTITEYRAACTSIDGGSPGTANDTTSPITVTGLTNGKTYTCTVAAWNAIGHGPESATSQNVLVNPVPDAPASLSASVNGVNRIIITFTPAATGAPPTGFTASCASSDGGDPSSGSGSDSPVFVSGLTNNKTYTCTLVASNDSGESAPTDATDPIVAIDVPAQPDPPTATGGAGYVDVTFDYTPVAGAPVDTFDATCTPVGGDPETDGVTSSEASSPIHVDHLAAGDYTCTLTAVNSVGMTTSLESEETTVTVVVSAPDPPTSVVATPTGTQASVAFAPPGFDGNDSITGYTATCTSSNGGTMRSASHADSPVVVTNLSKGKTYACTVVATNSFDDSVSSASSDPFDIDATAPGVPTGVAATSQAGALSVAFTAPADTGGHAITGYTATCTSSNGGTTGSDTGSSSPIVVDTLDNGYTYTCTVLATNSVGDSANSAASASSIPNVNPGAPGIPAKPTLTSGDQSASVAFTAPAPGDASIDSYTASCYDGSQTISETGTTSPIVVHGLGNGVANTCWITATNAFGEGAASPSDDVTPATIPDAPTITGVRGGFQRIQVTFDPPLDNGGATITLYTVTCDGDSDPESGASSPIVVDNLDMDRSYSCVVRATNAVGESGPSASVDDILPAQVTPDAPTIASVTQIDGGLRVVITPGLNLGVPVDNYHAYCTSSDGGAAGSDSTAGTTLEVGGLTPGKHYTCTATSENADGESDPSAASSSFEVTAHPAAPAKPTATAGTGQVSVAFSAPSDNGSTITSFTAGCTSSDGGDPNAHAGASSPIVVGSLDNNHHYTCTVTATNAFGPGDASPASDAVLVGDSVPDAPTGVQVERIDLGARVTWDEPLVDQHITGYTVTCTGYPAGSPISNTGADQPIDVPNLDYGTDYTCSVVATNTNGDSAASSPSDVFRVATAPGDPSAVDIAENGDGFDVTFLQSDTDGGSSPLDYVATCASSDGGATNTDDGAAPPVHVGTLTRGHTYTCSVFASNGVATSNEAFSSSASLEYTAPSTPTDVVATSQDGALSVAFNTPADNGGNTITGYTATCTSSNGGTTGSDTGTDSPVVVDNLDDGYTYTCTVLATNTTGDSEASAASDPAIPNIQSGSPGIVAKPTVAAGDGSVTVSFAAAADGDAPIISYEAFCTDGDNGYNNFGSNSPITIAGLPNDQTYTCTVTANNSIGVGRTSPASDPFTPHAATVPDAPAAPTVTQQNGQLSVAFTAPDDGGATITGYTATCTSSNGGTLGSETDTDSPLTVTGLNNGYTYTCTALATNVKGDSDLSDASDPAIPNVDPGAPGIITKPTVEAGDAQIIVTFDPPAPGDDAIDSYTATCGEGITTISISDTQSPITIYGLSDGTTYTCWVTATNSFGEGEPSPASDPAVPARAPDPPINVSVAGGDLRAIVSFAAPFDTGGLDILNYIATCTSSNGGTLGAVAGTTSPITVPDLTDGKSYRCRVKASNAAGTSSDSDPSLSFVAGHYPGPPTSVHFTVTGSFEGFVSFTPPADSGHPILGYNARCDSTDGGDLGGGSDTSPPIDVGNAMTVGKHYQCIATAITEIGESAESLPSPITVYAIAPEAPSQPTVDYTSGTTAEVAVSPPNDNGSAITGYTATCASSDGGTTRSASNATSPVTVASLSAGKAYTCTATATNEAGTSSASDASDSFTVDATAPGAPTGVSAARQLASLDVSFTAPDDDGGDAITGYTAACTSSNGGATGSHSGASSPITVTGLTNGKTYTCTVMATNTHGDGTVSPASDDVVVGAVPGAPTDVVSTRVSPASASVTMTDGTNTGSAITGYRGQCNSTDGGASNGVNSATLPILVPALTVGKHYKCTGYVFNAEGTSAGSDPSDEFVAASIPSLPAAPTVQVAGSDTIRVSYTEPADNGDAFINFAARCISTDGGDSGSESGMTSPIEVADLSPGHTYKCDMLAYNNMGGSGFGDDSDPIVLTAVAPDPPGAVNVSADLDNGALDVEFVEPYDGGATITAYHVSCTSPDGGTTVTADGTSSPIEVPGGTPGATYGCAVTAENSAGTSNASDASNEVTADSKPEAPSDVTVARADNAAIVSFTPGTNNGTPVGLYAVTCTSSDGGGTIVAGGTYSPTGVSGLWHGFTYTCTVRAENDAGASAESDPSDAFVVISVPSVPGTPSVTPDHTTATVTFAGSSDNGGAAVDHYAVTCVSSDGGATRAAIGPTAPIDVTTLSAGKTYTCSVQPVNEAGFGAAAVSDPFTVVGAPPGPPTAIQIDIDTSGLQIGFTAPSDTGSSAITGYDASCTSSDGGDPVTGHATSSPIAVTGATVSKTYQCTVTASNDDGAGDASSASDPFTADALPEAPLIVTILRTGTQFSTFIVAFTFGANNGSPITDVTVTCPGVHGGSMGFGTGLSSPITVTGLDPGNDYHCLVRVTNGAGSSISGLSFVIVAGISPSVTVAPKITGTTTAERKLTVSNGTWRGAPAPTYTRQWKRCDKNGNACANISGAHGSTYTLTNADVDKTIRVAVSATNVIDSASATTGKSALVLTVPVASSGGYYYVSGNTAKKAPAGYVGAASHGNTTWMVTPTGNVSGPHFGPGNGTLVGRKLKKPVIGIVVTPSGKGYWMFAADGGIFTFGDAHFYGSTGALRLRAPIVSMASMPNGKGYWLFAADGGVFTFGDARFYGSTGAKNLAYPVVAMLATPSAHGYWLITRDGKAIRFGDAPNIGTAGAHKDIVGLVSLGAGYRFVTNRGQLVSPVR